MNTPTKLFSNQTTDGSSESFPSRGNFASVIAAGTFDGATLTVQVSPDFGTTWVNTTSVLTDAGAINVVVGQTCLLRLSLSDAGASTSVNVWVALRD